MSLPPSPDPQPAGLLSGGLLRHPLVLVSFGLLVGGFGGFLLGRQSEPAEPPAATAPSPVEPAAEEDVFAAVMGAQDRVARLEGELAATEARLADLRAGNDGGETTDQARLQDEQARLEIALAEARAEREAWRVQLEDTLLVLDSTVGQLDRARKDRNRLARSNQQLEADRAENLWQAFTASASARVCDRGSKKAHQRCEDALATFFDAPARARFGACVEGGHALPVLMQVEDEAALPASATPLPEDNRLTRRGWAVFWCDGALPEQALSTGQ